MNSKLLFSFFVAILFACKEPVIITFSEVSSEYSENAIIEMNLPKAQGSDDTSGKINSIIESHVANMLNFSEEESDTIAIISAIERFDKEYSNFKFDFEESSLKWEATFDGEVTYQSSTIITIAINSYLNTGGAHGNMNITLFNFDASTGDLLTIDDLFSDKKGLEELTKMHFKIATKNTTEDGFGEYFFGEEFHLPANIGYSDEGILMFYNVYEIASYAIGITEFTIPFEDIEDLLLGL